MRRETFHTPGPLRLEVRNPAGRIEIRTVDGEETTVAVDSRDDVEDAVTVELRERDGGHELVVAVEEERRLRFLRTAPQVDIEITCPHGAWLAAKAVSADLVAEGRLAGVDVKTVSGDVELDRVEGDASLNTVSGDLRAGEIAGRARLRSVSGDLRADRVGGPAEVKTVSGDVRIDEAESSVEGQTISGDVILRAVSEGKVGLRSVSGDLLVGVRSGSKVWLDVKSTSGDTSSELAVGDAPPSDDGPSLEVVASAMSGDIRIVRA